MTFISKPGSTVAVRAGVPTAITSLLILLAAALALGTRKYDGGSADLLALWLAAEAVAQGHYDIIYPPSSGLFTVLPPEGWIDMAWQQGYDGAIFPYIYPPLWVWLLAPLTDLISFESFATAASFINPLLVGFTLLVAHKLAAPTMNQAAYLALGILFLIPTSIGIVSIMQNQPQILVALLILLAIERDESDSSVLAGALMALAAALKVYPLLYALVWAVQGRWRAVASFVAVGAGLAALSVAVAGWPMHRWFLDLLEQMYRTALLTNISYSLSPLFAQLVMADTLQVIKPELWGGVDPDFGWRVTETPAWLQIAMKLASVAAVVAGGRALRRSDAAARAAIWPAIMIALSLLAPVSWCCHYLAPAAFVPMLFSRLPVPRAGVIAIAVALATFPLAMPDYARWLPVPLGPQLIGVLSMLLLAAAFLVARERGPWPDDMGAGATVSQNGRTTLPE